ncbi:MAG: hypothetical protein GW795_12650 [Cyanobacteria bacterium]|nr:hypothetical protein [Cyanobacteria bacterium CG_2015-16_32_12]NCO78447.1 hypothetical protein [Cyanobacteria bacterium CG_2015-22_32_23]NCQ04834.1 hypothetical protein [Cyanobacteria bacterium CG_2015-09_32_10]NCQ42692.1 hypothetical protein [Cyanobacteria bacterium CG_2015-04_32_10]NCS84262.1 hypothetical protein [Cyanobacteria bacterium CG_2015-02_32_10]
MEFFSWEISRSTIVGSCLWCLALYISFASLRESIIDGLNRGFNYAQNFIFTNEKVFNPTQRESQNVFLASLTSIIPFFIIAIICNLVVEIALGKSWLISVGILACIACAVYDLGRRDSQR